MPAAMRTACTHCRPAPNTQIAVTSHDVPTPKTFNFRLSPHNADVLGRVLRLSYVSLANNHSLDYGLPGLADTLQVRIRTSTYWL